CIILHIGFDFFFFQAEDGIRDFHVTGVQTCALPIYTALTIESRYFTYLATGQISKNMIGTFWHGLNAIKSGASRPQGIAAWKAKIGRASCRERVESWEGGGWSTNMKDVVLVRTQKQQ